jgi:isocitrate/isopropylmalate dehydrogenase
VSKHPSNNDHQFSQCIDIPKNATLWGFRLPLRQELKQWVHVQPARVLRGIQSPLRNIAPEYINWVIVHENSEGEHSGHGGVTHKDSPYEIATDVSIFTRAAIDRVVRFAFDLAKSRARRRLTLVSKSNGQKHAMILCKLDPEELFNSLANIFKGKRYLWKPIEIIQQSQSIKCKPTKSHQT